MTLLIFPGGGNTSYQKYKSTYKLIEDGASQFGYGETDLSLRWPGHHEKGEDPDDGLTFGGAVNAAVNHVHGLGQVEEEFDILARSFGTLVAAQVAISERPKNLGKLILWGVPTYWIFWRMWKKNFKENKAKAKSKGLHVEDSFFSTLTPFEVMINDLNYPTVIASGEDDKVSPPAFIKYLSSLIPEHENINFRVVSESSHVVDTNSPPRVRGEYQKNYSLELSVLQKQV